MMRFLRMLAGDDHHRRPAFSNKSAFATSALESLVGGARRSGNRTASTGALITDTGELVADFWMCA